MVTSNTSGSRFQILSFIIFQLHILNLASVYTFVQNRKQCWPHRVANKTQNRRYITCSQLPYTNMPPSCCTHTRRRVISLCGWEPRFRGFSYTSSKWWRHRSFPSLSDFKFCAFSGSGRVNFLLRRFLKSTDDGAGKQTRRLIYQWLLESWCFMENVLAKKRCVFKLMSLIPAKVNPGTICSGKLHLADSSA